MSKTITIPKNNNPFIVNINNREYIYKGGETVEVPDEVAEIIQHHVDSVPKPLEIEDNVSGKNYLPSYIDGSLTEITAEMIEGATCIGSYMFAHSKIVGITIPNSVTKIDKYAFYNCSALKSVTIPEGITELPQEAFVNCKALTSIVIPNKVNSIGTSVFANCTNLKSAYLPETPPTLANVNAFNNINPACVFYCKTQASFDAYKAASNWNTLSGTYSFTLES